MIYDYGGFPPHTYEVQYKAPGAPELAAQVKQLLDAGGLPAQLDPQRGFDHGTFSAMYPVYPNADVPIVQLSLKHGLDPLTHLEAGRLLAPLREQGVLIVGSGLSYHNLRAFNAQGAAASHAFDEWLRATMALPPQQRAAQLMEWEKAPAARMGASTRGASAAADGGAGRGGERSGQRPLSRGRVHGGFGRIKLPLRLTLVVPAKAGIHA